MNRISVNSSNLDSVGYESSTNTLEIEFKVVEFINTITYLKTSMTN